MNHSISQLRYRILQGKTPLEPLKVLDSRSICHAGWLVTFYVLGASHAVIFRNDDREFSELFTCLPPTLPQSAIVDVPGDVASADVYNIDGARFDVQIEPADFNGCVQTDYEEMASSGGRDSLQYTFGPSLSQPAPITIVSWRDEGGCLMIWTLHTYPNEGTSVTTTTRVVLPPVCELDADTGTELREVVA